MVRLVDIETQNVSSGFVEVYINGKWGPVCNLEMEDADAVCQQLSYTGAVLVEDMNTTE